MGTSEVAEQGVAPSTKVGRLRHPGVMGTLLTYSLPLLFFALEYAWTHLEGGFDYEAIDWLGQSLGTQALEHDVWRNLLATHVQPPGLNGLYALLLNSPLDAHFAFVLVFYVVALATIVLIASSLRNLGASKAAACLAACVFAALPTTSLYALWPYNTSLVALCRCASIWSITLMRRRPMWGLVLWCMSTTALFLLRPSFVWPVTLCWLAVPLFFLPKSRRRVGYLIAGSAGAVVLVVQGYFLAQFGLITTSSWSGQNVVKALVESSAVGTEDLVAAAGEDPCLLSIAQTPRFFDQGPGPYEKCPGGFESLADWAPVLQESGKADNSLQLNNLRELQLASAWSSLARNLLVAHPLAPIKMALGFGSNKGSFEIMFGPGFAYSPLIKNLWSGGITMSIFRPLGVVFPTGSLLLVVAGAAFAVRKRHAALWVRRTFWVCASVVAYALAVGLLIEYGENQRFLVEAYPVLTIASAIVIVATLQTMRSAPTRKGWTAKGDEVRTSEDSGPSHEDRGEKFTSH